MPSFRSKVVYWVTKAVVGVFYNPQSSIQRIRREFTITTKLIPQKQAGSFESTTVDGIPAVWVIPDQITNDKVVLYFHGGGYSVCSPETHKKMCSIMARESGTKFLLIDYRLAPENPFPAAIEDALKAYAWLQKRYSADKIIFGGDSAGGGLTVSTLLRLKEKGENLPLKAFCLSPWLDLASTGESYQINRFKDAYIDFESIRRWSVFYAPESMHKNPLVSPLYGDLTGLPPMMVQVSDIEILKSDSVVFAERAKAAGVDMDLEVWEGMVHVWQMWTGILPEALQSIKLLAKFINS